MALTIHKYPLEIADEVAIQMRAPVQVLCVQVQHGRPFIWAKVDEDRPLVNMTFRVCGTGFPADDTGGYLGSFQLYDGSLVYHVFQKA